jgi:hypothetical protein
MVSDPNILKVISRVSGLSKTKFPLLQLKKYRCHEIYVSVKA